MNHGHPTCRVRWLWPAAVFAVVLGAQLWLVAAAGTDIPFQDQWDAEGRGLYPAVQDDAVDTRMLLRAHNEHRIFWTQLLNWGLFAANGQWDPLMQLGVNALLHAAGAALLAAGLRRTGISGWILGIGVVLFSLPLAGWHNALWGFQSQVYFAVLFAVAAFGLLEPGKLPPPRAAAGQLAGLAALVAMGPGLLVPVALAGGLLGRARERRLRWPEVGPVVALGLVAFFSYQPAAGHAALHVQSAGQFLSALGRLLAWPHSGQPWAALVLNLPLAVLVTGRLARRRTVAAGENFVTLLGGWAVLVALGAAWSRGGGDEFVAGVPSRYADFIALLPLANAWAVIQLAGEARVEWRASGRLVAVAWGVFLLAGWAGLSAEVVRGVILPRVRDREAPVRLVQEFQRTGNPAVFAGQPRLLVPHPDPGVVRAVLDDPRLRGALPPSLQPAQPLGPLSRAVREILGR